MSAQGTLAFLGSISKEQVEEQVQQSETPEEVVEELEEAVVENEEVETTEGDSEQAELENEEEEIFYPLYDDDEEEVVAETTETVVPEQSAPVFEKLNYSAKDYLEANKDKIKEYLELSSLDLGSMSPEDVVRLKIQRDNSYYTQEDVDDVMLEKYGVGLKLKSIPEDAYEEDIVKITAENEKITTLIKRGERRLKADVAEAITSLNSVKDSVELPDLEFEVDRAKYSDPEAVIGGYIEEQTKIQEDFYNEVWVPNVKQNLANFQGFKAKVEVDSTDGEKVFSEYTYRLTEKQKKELEDYLSVYVAQPRDQKYVNAETGEVNMQKLIRDKTKELFTDEIIKISTKEAVTKFKESFIKKDLINYQDEPRKNRAVAQGTKIKDPAVAWFQQSAQNRHR